MKTFILWICAAVMAVSFTNCGNKQTETKLDPELEKQLGTIKTAAEEGAEFIAAQMKADPALKKTQSGLVYKITEQRPRGGAVCPCPRSVTGQRSTENPYYCKQAVLQKGVLSCKTACSFLRSIITQYLAVFQRIPHIFTALQKSTPFCKTACLQ